jgi:hypothetical protein
MIPNKETLRAMVQNGEVTDGYLMVAACFYQLVEDGARFYLTETQIKFCMPGVCDWCAQDLPDEEWKQDYYIDIITPNIVDDED